MSTTDLPGPSLLVGRYRLVERLGAGGMSVVWRGFDEVLSRQVAVKVLPLSVSADPSFRRRLRAEAQAAARLSHPHITNVYDYGEAVTGDGDLVPFVVMELVDGESLAGLLSRMPQLSWQVAVRICAQVSAALAAAHARGIVHRDVTPANVMLTSSGAKVVDFGISALIGENDIDPDGSLLGTPAYLAPERLEGGQVSPASDVYAVGLLIYRAIIGQLPWDVGTTTALLRAHQYTEPEPLPAVEGMPRAVNALVGRCLEKNPADRPSSAELAVVMAQIAASAPIASSSSSMTDYGQDTTILPPRSEIDRASRVMARAAAAPASARPGSAASPAWPGSAGPSGWPAPAAPSGWPAPAAPPAGMQAAQAASDAEAAGPVSAVPAAPPTGSVWSGLMAVEGGVDDVDRPSPDRQPGVDGAAQSSPPAEPGSSSSGLRPGTAIGSGTPRNSRFSSQGQAGPAQAGPAQAGPPQVVAGQAVPGQAVPGQAVPGQAVPGQAVPGQAGDGGSESADAAESWRARQPRRDFVAPVARPAVPATGAPSVGRSSWPSADLSDARVGPSAARIRPPAGSVSPQHHDPRSVVPGQRPGGSRGSGHEPVAAMGSGPAAAYTGPRQSAVGGRRLSLVLGAVLAAGALAYGWASYQGPKMTGLPPAPQGAVATDERRCVVTYGISSHTGTKFVAAMTVTNRSSAELADWKLRFVLRGDQTMTGIGGATLTQLGRDVTVQSTDALAPHRTVVLGLSGGYRTSNEVPVDFDLGGVACDVYVSPTPGAPPKQVQRTPDGEVNLVAQAPGTPVPGLSSGPTGYVPAGTDDVDTDGDGDGDPVVPPIIPVTTADPETTGSPATSTSSSPVSGFPGGPFTASPSSSRPSQPPPSPPDPVAGEDHPSSSSSSSSPSDSPSPSPTSESPSPPPEPPGGVPPFGHP